MNRIAPDVMRSPPQSTIEASKRALESGLSLRLMSAIEGDRHVSQRSLALRLGIAVGLANAYLKRCTLKGWVKIQRVPARRYAYYLTPTGFAEKSRLTAEYLTDSFAFVRRARAQCLEALQHCEWKGWRRVVLAGDGELAEIATLAARETSIELVAVIAPGCNVPEIAGLPVASSIDAVSEIDAVLVTDIKTPQETYDVLRGRLDDERVLTPALLHVSRANPAGKEKRDP